MTEKERRLVLEAKTIDAVESSPIVDDLGFSRVVISKTGPPFALMIGTASRISCEVSDC